MKSTAKSLAGLIRTVAGKEKVRPYTTAIVVAAGNGSRMGGNMSKQLIDLDGMPVIIRTLVPFEQSEYIDDIILVTRDEDRERIVSLADKFGVKKLRLTVSGGESRQESVMCGFRRIKDECKFVAIHDGARCLIKTEDIQRVCESAYKHGAATLSTEVTDTVKSRLSGGFIDFDTQLKREEIRLVQTPQVFGVNLYRAAAYTAADSGFRATDDCALVENIKHTVKLVKGRRDNIKITSPEDLLLAKIYLEVYKQGLEVEHPPFDDSDEDTPASDGEEKA